MTNYSAPRHLTAGELARQCGVSTDTLRHYERMGVLPPVERRPNGYRSYDSASVARVRLVRQALLIGFTLEELARILKVRDGGGAPCRKVRAMAAGKLKNFERRLDELISVRDQLRATLKDWDKRLQRTSPNRRSYLLENLTISAGVAGNHEAFKTNGTKCNSERKTK